MFIPYTNQAEVTRLHAFLCMVNINTMWAFVSQCNFDGKKNDDKDFNPKGPNQRVSVGAGGDVYGLTIAGNVLRVHRKARLRFKTSSQKIQAAEEVRDNS